MPTLDVILRSTVLTKWKTLSFVHLMTYLEKTHLSNNMQGFLLTAHLVHSLAQFDTMFEIKLATHLLLQSSQQTLAGPQAFKLLQGYASLFYCVGPPTSASQ